MPGYSHHNSLHLQLRLEMQRAPVCLSSCYSKHLHDIPLHLGTPGILPFVL